MATAHPHVSPSYVFRLIVVLFTFFDIVSSAVIRVSHSNLTTDSVANGNQCTDSYTWIGTGSTSVDCVGAVQSLYDADVKDFSDTDFEFLSEKALRRSLPAIRTPRKYTVGTCTLAIVMLNFFSEGELPGGAEGPFASRDVTSFYELWQAAQQIEATCLMQHSRPGWAAEGGRGAVGIFLWATDSFENQRVPQGEPTVDAPIGLAGHSLNLSSTENQLFSSRLLETRSRKMVD